MKKLILICVVFFLTGCNDTTPGSSSDSSIVAVTASGSHVSLSSVSPITMASGFTSFVTVTPDTGYTASETVDGTCASGSWSGNVYTTGKVTASCTLVFSATLNKYEVTVSGGGNETFTPSTPQTVDHGSTVSFTVAANSGYVLSTVGGTCVSGSWSGSTYTTGAVTANCTVIFSSTLFTYSVTPSVTNATVAPTSALVVPGATQTFGLTAAGGYLLDYNISGTCPTGSWSGSNYTTGAISADCGVSFAGYLAWSGVKQVGVAAKTADFRFSLTDSANNVYVAGDTSGGLHGNTQSGTTDAVVVKYHPSGSVTWAKQIGVASAATTGSGLAIDSSGNIYLVGQTAGALPTSGGLVGSQDYFLAKYNSSGTRQWVVQLGVSGVSSGGGGVAVDTSENVYVTGSTRGAFPGNSLTGNWDLFIAKYTSSGTRTWIKQLGVSSKDTFANRVIVDTSGNSYLGGTTTGALPGNSLNGSYDYLIAKYDSSGTLTWVKQLGVNTKVTTGDGIVMSTDGAIFLTGKTGGALPGNSLSGGQDYFLAKYDSSGSRAWIKQYGGAAASDTGIAGAAVDSSNNVYVSGWTNDSLYGNTKAGTYDCMVAKHDSSGNMTWLKQVGGAGNQSACWGPSVDSLGNVFVAGYTNSSLPGNTLTGTRDYFVAKWNSAGTLQ